MSFTALVSDSTAGLSPEFVEEHNISIVPLYLKIGEQMYRDKVDITPEAFYERLPHTTPLPTTSQPSAGDFAKVYGELVEQGATAIISVLISSGISGTVSSANTAAKEFPAVRMEIVDTLTASASHMLAVEAGARAMARGADVDQTLSVIQGAIAGQKIAFTVDTLEYLYKGGRIGGAAALFGSLLQFKPLLYLTEENGTIDALERVRTSKRALSRMVEVMGEWQGTDEPLSVVAIHAACPERAQAVIDLARKRLKVSDARILPLTPVLGAHVGNGTVGISACPTSLLHLNG
jgi:DegV family protein with EDD domain